MQSANSPPASYCLNIYFLYFQFMKQIKKIIVIKFCRTCTINSHIFANGNKANAWLYNFLIRFSTTFTFNKAIYSCSFQRWTSSLKICIGVTSIRIYYHDPVPFTTFIGDRLPCGEDWVFRDAFTCNFFITNTCCPLFPTCYMCYLSSHKITPVHKGRLFTLHS